jgi:hypothetical protein
MRSAGLLGTARPCEPGLKALPHPRPEGIIVALAEQIG